MTSIFIYVDGLNSWSFDLIKQNHDFMKPQCHLNNSAGNSLLYNYYPTLSVVSLLVSNSSAGRNKTRRAR